MIGLCGGLITEALCSGGDKSAVIQPLSVTANGTYTVPEGVDGYSPVNVGVPDRYQDGYDSGYSDGYDFASDFYNNVIDETKKYTIVFYFGDELQPGLRWIMCSIRNTADMSEMRHFNWWPTSMDHCYNAKFTKIWWAYPASSADNVPQVEISSTDSSGQNREKYTRPFYKSEIWPSYGYTPYNSNIISSIPTTE